MASSTHMLDARGNYWGDPRGPLDSSDQADLVKAAGHTYHNPDSTGESVSNNVLYDGWLGAIPVWDGYLWSDAADRGDGWRHSSWYGWFNDTLFPHILHTEHGWQYCMGDSQRHMWIYDYALGSWLYVSRDFHPVIYKYGAHAGWYGYYKGGRTPRRWFHHFASGTDFTEANLK
jgi:hypothetical protein